MISTRVTTAPDRVLHAAAGRLGQGFRTFWTCWWWALRAHVAASHNIPRSCLEPPPADWLTPLAGRPAPPALPRRRGNGLATFRPKAL